MATVEKSVTKREVVTEVEEKVYVLTLTPEEAVVLKCLVGATGGTGRFRKILDSIFDSFDKSGVDVDDKMYWYESNNRKFKIDVSEVQIPPDLDTLA